MKFNQLIRMALGALFLTLGTIAPASANPAMDKDLTQLKEDWATIRYKVSGDSAQYDKLVALRTKATALEKKYPGEAEPVLWEGIIASEIAAHASTFKQLGYAKEARDLMTKAYGMDPKVDKGGAAMSLGTLYSKVPGFPIGFGSKSKAEKYLKAALAQDPNGMDANYFYGEFLADKGDSRAARTYLAKALAAPRDSTRPVWDAGRRGEIRELVAKISKQASR